MEIPLYQVDAFTKKKFAGNPAAICPLTEWLDDTTLQAIGRENNLSETAFLVQQESHYELRWFTPAIEVDLCGHATLASAFVVFEYLAPSANSVVFQTKSGKLTVNQKNSQLVMDFPARPGAPVDAPQHLIAGLGKEPLEVQAADDYMAIYENEEDIKALQPDMTQLIQLDRRGVIITAPGKNVDFVSRFFAPKAGIPEDPVTGSAHCTLAPYWTEKLGKTELHALQISDRGGELFCQAHQERVRIAGHAVLTVKGTIYL